MLLPLLVGAAIALTPAPPGLPQYAWYYFAIFATVITGLVVEPIPAAAVGLMRRRRRRGAGPLRAVRPGPGRQAGLQPDRQRR